MKSSLNQTAAIAGGLILLGLGLPVFFLLGNEGCLSEANISHTITTLLVIICLEICSVIFIAHLYDRWVYVKSFAKGALNGAWLFSLFAFNGALIYAYLCVNRQLDFTSITSLTTLSVLFFYTVSSGLRGAIAGGVMGWVLGRKRLA